jgi:hypothetical protein
VKQIANDTESILDYFEDVFGERARRPVVVAEPEWYLLSSKTHLISINLMIAISKRKY